MEQKQETGNDILNGFLSNIAEGHEHIIDIAKKTLEDDKEKLTFAMQKRVLQPEEPKPLVRKESPRRAHVFHSAESFVDYLKEYKTEKTVVLADVGSNLIQAVLDDEAKTGFEVIRFKPQIHPLFAPWENKIIGCRIPIKDFAIFLQQNKRTIQTPDAKELTIFFSQVRASQKINIHEGIGQGCINGLTCELTIMGKKENQEVELPESMTINVPIYIDTKSQDIEIDILLGAANTEVFVQCSSSALDLYKVDAFSEMIEKIRKVDGLVVGFGTVQNDAWDYLPNRNG